MKMNKKAVIFGVKSYKLTNSEKYLLKREKRYNFKPTLFKPTIISNYNYKNNDNLIIKIGSKHEYNYKINK